MVERERTDRSALGRRVPRAGIRRRCGMLISRGAAAGGNGEVLVRDPAWQRCIGGRRERLMSCEIRRRFSCSGNAMTSRLEVSGENVG